MKRLSLMIYFVCLTFVFSPVMVFAQCPDQDATTVSEQAKKVTSAPESSKSRAPSGNLLFSWNGPENAACIRSVPDVNNDGKDDIIVGIDISQQDNLFCLSGASTGTATVLWSLQTLDGVSGGGFWGDGCLTPSSDVDQNGYANILAGTAWGGRTAYNLDASDGSTIWKLDTYTLPDSGWIYNLSECDDVNGDTVPDVVFGTGSYCDTLFMIDGTSMGGNPTVIWSIPTSDAVYKVNDIGDVNRDFIPDIIAAIGDSGDEIICCAGHNGDEIWSFEPSGYTTSVYSCGVIPSLDIPTEGNDYINEAIAVLWTNDGSAIRCLDGKTGDEIWASTEVNGSGMAVDLIDDLDGDGNYDIVVSASEDAVTVLSGLDGSVIWKTAVGDYVWTARAIDDLNGDGYQDVIAGSFDHNIYAMNGRNGKIFWEYGTGNRVFSVYPVGDLNGDGRCEVAAGMQDMNHSTVVYVVEGDSNIPFPGLELIGTGQLETYFGMEVTGDPASLAYIFYSLGTGSTYLPAYGLFELAVPFYTLILGTIPPLGPFEIGTMLPNDPGLNGLTVYFQSLVGVGPGNGALTNMQGVTFFE